MLRVVYGVDINEDHDKFAVPFNVSAEGIAHALAPGKYIVELLPFLKGVPKWVPGFAWQADFERWRAAVHDVKNIPFAHTKEAMVSIFFSSLLWIPGLDAVLISTPNQAHGKALDSLVAKTLSEPGNAEELEEMAKGIGLVSYEGELREALLFLSSQKLTKVLSSPAGADTVSRFYYAMNL